MKILLQENYIFFQGLVAMVIKARIKDFQKVVLLIEYTEYLIEQKMPWFINQKGKMFACFYYNKDKGFLSQMFILYHPK